MDDLPLDARVKGAPTDPDAPVDPYFLPVAARVSVHNLPSLL
jgi:hypothetical protein